MRRNIININNAFLFYSFMYQLAFGHFIEQCITKINFFMTIKNTIKNIKFCIPKKRYNALTKEIVKFLEINEDDLIILNEDTTYIVDNLYYESKGMDGIFQKTVPYTKEITLKNFQGKNLGMPEKTFDYMFLWDTTKYSFHF